MWTSLCAFYGPAKTAEPERASIRRSPVTSRTQDHVEAWSGRVKLFQDTPAWSLRHARGYKTCPVSPWEGHRLVRILKLSIESQRLYYVRHTSLALLEACVAHCHWASHIYSIALFIIIKISLYNISANIIPFLLIFIISYTTPISNSYN